MAKTTTAGMDTHLLKEVTTLAMAVVIERVDGVKFRLTTSSEDIKIDIGDGDGVQTYSASESVSRTSIENDAELNVDNLDVIGIFSNDLLKEKELRGGSFDFSDFKIFVFNHQDLTDGIIKIFRGQFGEVVVTPTGFFQVQVRSMVQVYSKQTGEHYTKDCRADLGDIRCRVPIFPALLVKETALALGDFFIIPTAPENNDCGKIIMNFEGVDGATSGVGFDNIGTNGTQPSLIGDVQIDTAQAPAGGDSTSSMLFDGTGDRLFWSDDTDWTLGTGEVTVQGHFRLGGVGINQCLASHWTETGNQRGWFLRVTAANVLEFAVSANGSTTDITLTGTTVLTVDTDHHAVIVRKGNGDWVLFLDGDIEAGPTTPTGDPKDPTTALRLGALEGGIIAATGVLTLTANATDTETVTIDTKVYTFQTTLTDVDGNVLIGATASDSLDNLIAAITLGAGAGTLYAASTTLHPTVTAAAGVGDTLDATAKTLGTNGNSIATTETLASGSWGGATLSGGTNGIKEDFNGHLDSFEFMVSFARWEVNKIFATGALTLTANAADTETVTIDTKTYTFQTTLTDVDGNVLIGATASDSLDNLIAAVMLGTRGLAAATGVLTFTGNAADTETVTIDTKVYTFQTTLTDVDGNVLIGATASDSLDNLIAAITLGAGSGTTYAASTTLHPTVTAAAGTGDTLDVTAKTKGIEGNSIVTTETVASGSWANATLLGGLSAYAPATTLHPTVKAAAGVGDTLDATAKTPGPAANSIVTTETLAAGSWANATLTGGAAFIPPTGNLSNKNSDLSLNWPAFGQRIYEVTTAGTTAVCINAPNQTVNGTHSQGSATLTAFNSWMREAIVSAVDAQEPRRKFSVTELTPISGQSVNSNSTPNVLGFPNDWFNGGAAFFETGNNVKKVVEVRDFIEGVATQTIELFVDLPLDIAVGDKLRIFAGCDKTNPICISKFDNGINFVGEPYVPGEDVIGQYPDAR